MWLISRFLCIQNPVMLFNASICWLCVKKIPVSLFNTYLPAHYFSLSHWCLLYYFLAYFHSFFLFLILSPFFFLSFFLFLPFYRSPFFYLSLSLFFLLSLCVSSHSLFLCVISLWLFLSWLCICLHMKSYMCCVYVPKAGCVSVCAYFTQVSQIFEINVFSFLWNIVKFGLFFFFLLLWGKSPVIEKTGNWNGRTISIW